ncbi:hypothetical protein [Massilia sp.]|uniref:hypothetical protein n=1 Tax=Massilia sp. TaxID=1882437 RepID=UPI00391CA238
MKIQIVNVSVGQTAKVLAVLYTVMSLPIMLFVTAAGFVGGGLGAGIGVAIMTLLIAPLVYGLLTFLFAGLVAWLYNLVARRVGGLEYSIADMSDAAAKT